MKEWAARAKAAVDADSGSDPETETDHLHFSPLMDGRFQLDGQLCGDNAKAVEEGLNACLPELVEGEPILPYSQRLAAALVEMARRALQNAGSPARRSIDMTVLIDWQDYRHCAFPGCTMKPIWCEAHHVEEYDRDDGPTDIDNMALLCSRHHKSVHSAGWSAKMEPGQQLAITTPDGRVLRGPPRTLH